MNQAVGSEQIFKLPPLEHQFRELEISGDKKFWGILYETGCGKTKTVIDQAVRLFGKGEINAMVVVSLTGVCAKWVKDEIPKHLPDHIERRAVLWGKDTAKLRQELETLKQDEPLVLHILSINIEALNTDRGYKAVHDFLLGHHALMVVDESTLIKNWKADRTKIAVKLGRLARYRRILNGTPSTQSPLDVYSQFEFLDHACLGFGSFYGFRNHFAVLEKQYVNNRSFDKVVGYQRLDELQKLVARFSTRVRKRDCLDLPDKIYDTRFVEMTPIQRKYYEALRDDALAVLGDGTTVAAPLVLTQYLRLRQALCNIAPTPAGSVMWIDPKHNPRREEVLQILREAGDQKVVIWSNFTDSIVQLTTAIREEFGAGFVECIYGGVKKEDRHPIKTLFQDESSSLRCIVANPVTLGVGDDLYAASLVIYHDNDWSVYYRLQSEDRTHRMGQTRNVTYIDLICPGTMDEKMRNALVQNIRLAQAVTGDNAPKQDSQITGALLREFLT